MKDEVMINIDMVGAPIPKDHPAFVKDLKIRKRIGQIEALIEIKRDMEDAKEASKALNNCLEAKNQKTIISTLGCMSFTILEALLSHIIVLYSKAFTESTGRTSLSRKVNEIFGNSIDKHEYMIFLRNRFYAHHEIEANRHQLFFLPNVPTQGKIKLLPDGQTARILMSSSINIGVIDECISMVKEYLCKWIEGLCMNLENDLTPVQMQVLLQTPVSVLFEKYWRESTKLKKHPLSSRC
jgi:hypothetical protein